MGLWIVLLIVAVATGAAREALLVPRLGEQLGHQIGTVAVMLLFFLVIYLTFPWLKIRTGKDCLQVGVFWVMLTIVFEFSFGHYVLGASWTQLLHDYNLFAGRLWTLVLLTVAAAPYLAGKLRGI